jgi:hypothetical protein
MYHKSQHKNNNSRGSSTDHGEQQRFPGKLTGAQARLFTLHMPSAEVEYSAEVEDACDHTPDAHPILATKSTAAYNSSVKSWWVSLSPMSASETVACHYLSALVTMKSGYLEMKLTRLASVARSTVAGILATVATTQMSAIAVKRRRRKGYVMRFGFIAWREEQERSIDALTGTDAGAGRRVQAPAPQTVYRAENFPLHVISFARPPISAELDELLRNATTDGLPQPPCRQRHRWSRQHHRCLAMENASPPASIDGTLSKRPAPARHRYYKPSSNAGIFPLETECCFLQRNLSLIYYAGWLQLY